MISKINSFEEYQSEYKKSIASPEQFWEEKAKTFLWKQPWDQVLEWDFNNYNCNWFINGKLNITENCLDRHLLEHGNKTAIIWEPNDPNDKSQHISYQDLHDHVCQFAHVLKNNGAKKGDRICLYMPMVPELAIAVLACARIGAIHSVVFAGFSANALKDRINDASCNIVITSDGLVRGNKRLCLKNIINTALEDCPSVIKTIVFKHTGEDVDMIAGRDVWWQDEITNAPKTFTAEEMDAEDPLFVLYTSGSTGKPKGVVHSCGGYMVYSEYSFRNVFQYEENDVYWCTADIGWITGHSYILYGPLLSGATTVMFEGIPTFPDAGRFWEICDKHEVNIFYTAPTAIRALEACDISLVKKHKLSTLKTLGSEGNP